MDVSAAVVTLRRTPSLASLASFSSVASDATLVCQPSAERAREFLDDWVDEDVVPFYYQAAQQASAAAAAAGAARGQTATPSHQLQGPPSSPSSQPSSEPTSDTESPKEPPVLLAIRTIFKKLSRSLIQGVSSSGSYGYHWGSIYDDAIFPPTGISDQAIEEIQRREAEQRQRREAERRERVQRREEERERRAREREERRKRNATRMLTEEEIREREAHHVAVFVPWI